ncbi:MAG: hypothetical protein EXR72_26640 [Myxococcales bacterium]|nr:hypothetical protein [Myxococcales bacterium]
MKLFYDPAYALSGHAFDTTRKARWVAESIAAAPIAGVDIVAPPPVSEALLLAVHGAAYIAAVRTGAPRSLAESQGFAWDPGLWPMVLASNGGAVAAALAALGGDGGSVAGSLSSGLHHAKRDHGDGYCTFNGLALAVHAALEAGARSILLLDLDAHCGGGTHSLLGDDPRVRHVDVAVDSFDHYVPSGRNTLDLINRADRYLPMVEARLAALDGERFDLCLYNAGMDPFEGCDIGGLAGITGAVLAQREELVFGWCRRTSTPVAFVLAGGYVGERLDRDALVGLHRLTIGVAARAAG